MLYALLFSAGLATAAAVSTAADATKVWPSIGGTSGYHRMAGRVAPTKSVSPRLAELKAEGQAVVDRRNEITTLELAARIGKDSMFIDEAALVEAQQFPISEAELIAKAKEFLYFGQGVEKPSLLAADFTFMGPFVGGAGGLPRANYLEAVGGFDIKVAFPDLEPRFMHFRADPLDAGRIWFTSQAGGTDTGGFLGNAPTGKRFETPPQACSIKFNAAGEVVKYTIGHVMERSVGNTGGLGGIFGPAYAIGKPLPFPEANPWKPSKRYRLLMLVGKLATWLKNKKGK